MKTAAISLVLSFVMAAGAGLAQAQPAPSPSVTWQPATQPTPAAVSITAPSGDALKRLQKDLKITIRKKKQSDSLDSTRTGILTEFTRYNFEITVENSGSTPSPALACKSIAVVMRGPAIGSKGKDVERKRELVEEPIEIAAIPARGKTELATKPVDLKNSRVRQGFAFDRANTVSRTEDTLEGLALQIRLGDQLVLETANPPSLLKDLAPKK